MPSFLVRAPDHLGDGVLALPALAAVCAAGPTRVVGPPWVAALYGHLPLASVPAPDIAVLFKPAFRAAWEARRVPCRVGLRSDHRAWLLTHAVAPQPGHRVEEFLAIARAAGVVGSGLPTLPVTAPPPELPPRAALLFPFSASGATVDWPFYAPLADGLEAAGFSPVFAGGPGQERRLAGVAGHHRVLPTLPLGEIAAAAVAAACVVGNDSGLTHLAAAARRGAGADVSAVHVVCGSTDPARTGAPGATPHRAAAPPPCWPCYRKTCSIGTPCLAVSWRSVAGAVVA